MREQPITAYVATDFHRKADAAEAGDALARHGVRLRARWVTEQAVTIEEGLGGELDAENAERAREVSAQDLEDIDASRVFVQLTNGEKKRGGNHVELGWALCRASGPGFRRPVVVVGPREHAFHYHPYVTHLGTLEDLDAWAAGYAAGLNL